MTKNCPYNKFTWIRLDEAARIGAFPSQDAVRKWIYRYNQNHPDQPIRRRHGAVVKEDLESALLHSASCSSPYAAMEGLFVVDPPHPGNQPKAGRVKFSHRGGHLQ